VGVLDSEFKPKEFNKALEYIKGYLAKVEPKPFVSQEIEIPTDEKQAAKSQESFISIHEEKSQSILDNLPNPLEVKWKARTLKFEKDDDNNFHIDFIHTASNLRAMVYGIGTVDRLKSKLIAGKIIPAIVTTTAFVTGLACFEIYKQHQKKYTC